MAWTGRLGRGPGRLNQHGTRVTAADLADTAVMGGSESRLPHSRVQPEIAYQLLRAVEPADVADRRHDAGGDRQVDVGDRHQSVDRGILDCVLRDLAVEQGQVFCQPVKLTDVPIDGGALIVWQLLSSQPGPAASVEQIGMRALRDQMRVQDRMHLVLEPRAMPHDLVAPRHQSALAFGLRVRRPDLR